MTEDFEPELQEEVEEEAWGCTDCPFEAPYETLIELHIMSRLVVVPPAV